MQRSLALLALCVLAAACDSAAISGKVHVGPGQDGLAIFALLWQLDETVPGDPKLNFLSSTAVGTAEATGGDFTYSFHGLQTGTYFVGAYADLFDDRTLTVDLVTIDLYDEVKSPIRIDTSADSNMSVTRDIFLGMSAPGTGTIRGVVHLSERASRLATTLYLLDKPLNQGAKLLQTLSLAATADASFQLFNVPLGGVHLMVSSDVGDDGELGNDFTAFHPQPIVLDDEQRKEENGLELWLDRQGLALGRVSGNISLNGRIATGRVHVQLRAGNDFETSDVVAVVNLPAENVMNVPFSVPSAPLGQLYVVGFIETLEAGRSLSTGRIYTLKDDPTALQLSAAAPEASGVELKLGVGRISGTIELESPPDALKELIVLASVPVVDPKPGSLPIDIIQSDVFEATRIAGKVVVRYEMFGLEDGTYDMTLVPDYSGDGDINDEFQSRAYVNGSPAKVTIVGGGRTGSDFKK